MSGERLVLSIEPLALRNPLSIVAVVVTTAEKRARRAESRSSVKNGNRSIGRLDLCRDSLTHGFSRRSPRSSVLAMQFHLTYPPCVTLATLRVTASRRVTRATPTFRRCQRETPLITEFDRRRRNTRFRCANKRRKRAPPSSTSALILIGWIL